jgi:hypothetical protein
LPNVPTNPILSVTASSLTVSWSNNSNPLPPLTSCLHAHLCVSW